MQSRENDSDCVIVDDIEGSSAKKLKVDIFCHSIIISGNDHCITKCFSTFFGEPLDKELDRLYL